MDEVKKLLTSWVTMCINPTENIMILSPLSEYWINEIRENLSDYLTEEDKYYIIKICGNTIKIEK